MDKILIALYDELETARDAADKLVDEGVDRELLDLVAYDPAGEYGKFLHTADDIPVTDEMDIGEPTQEGVSTAEAASFGAVVGTLGGIFASLAAGFFPGIGPVVAAGSVTATLATAAAGAATGGLIGALVDLGLSKETANLYAEGVRRGGTLLIARVPEGERREVWSVLAAHDPIDIDQRATQWRREGWTSFDTSGQPYSHVEVQRDRDLYTLEEEFREHYRENYAALDRPYEHYQPGYVLGHDLARDPRHQGLEWTDVRPEARKQWEEFDIGDWDDYQDAIYYGWTAKRRLT
jgi:hypothetical protein